MTYYIITFTVLGGTITFTSVPMNYNSARLAVELLKHDEYQNITMEEHKL